MKKILLVLTLLPTFSFASIYNCSGSGFVIDVAGNPLEMKIVGNGFNAIAQNVKITSTFNTEILGNTTNPVATIKLIIKDSSFGGPGDNFKGDLQIYSGAGTQEFFGLNCTRGND